MFCNCLSVATEAAFKKMEVHKRARTKEFAHVQKRCRHHSKLMQIDGTAGAGEEKSDFDRHDKIAVGISNYEWKHGPPVASQTSCTLKIKPLQLSCSPDSPKVLEAR